MDDDGMDSLFSSFMNEVTNIKSTKMKKIEEKSGNPDEIIERITASRYDPKQGFGSAFHILGISPEASDSEISKQYKRLSVLIHPDKCKNEKASEAFQVLAKAYADTKDPSYNDKYKDLVGPAKERVKKKREAENKVRVKRGEDPLDMEGNEFDQEVLREIERMTNATTEAASQSNSVYEANMKRMEEMQREARTAKKEQDREKRKFEANRDKRAAGWQVFMNNTESERSKRGRTYGKVGAADMFHKREERTEADGKAELDLTDKKVWRSDTQAGFTGVDREYRKLWR